MQAVLSRPWLAFVTCLIPLAAFYSWQVANSASLSMPPKPIGDGLDYENIAFHLWQGEGWVINNQSPAWRKPYEELAESYQLHLQAPARDLSATGRPPLYPTLVSGIYLLVGREAGAFALVRIAQAMLLATAGAFSVVLTLSLIRLSSRHTLNPSAVGWIPISAGVLSTLIFCMGNRTLSSYAEDFLTEPLALCLMQCFIVGLVISIPCGDDNRQEPHPATTRVALGLGILLGLMILARSIFVVWLPGFALLAYLASAGSRPLRLRFAATLVVTAVVVCGPWWLRNVAVLETAMPLGTQGPITLLGGNSDEAMLANGEWVPGPEQRLRKAATNDSRWQNASNDTQREVVIAKLASSQLKAWLAKNWQRLPTVFIQRVKTHWNPYYGKSLCWKLSALVGVAFLVLHGRQSDSTRRILIWLVGLLLISTFVAASLYTVGGRFLVPLYGLLNALAGYGIYGFVTLLLSTRPTPRAAA